MMLRRDKDSQEGYVHECKQGKDKPPVYLHDMQANMIIDGHYVAIKYCPYCGIEPQYDEYEKRFKK